MSVVGRNLGEVLNELSILISETHEASELSHGLGQFCYLYSFYEVLAFFDLAVGYDVA